MRAVIREVKPTVLIGTSTHARAFNEEIIREMKKYCERPIIMPMSNPTALAEADPIDIMEWTDGQALIATGSPFPPVPMADGKQCMSPHSETSGRSPLTTLQTSSLRRTSEYRIEDESIGDTS